MRRLLYYLRRRRFDRELEAEIQFHLEARVEELERSGLSSGDARAQARREFGPQTRAQEDTRAAWQFCWLEDLAADLRYALRALRRDPFQLRDKGLLVDRLGAGKRRRYRHHDAFENTSNGHKGLQTSAALAVLTVVAKLPGKLIRRRDDEGCQ